MIAVFIPALMLEVFSTYFLIKVTSNVLPVKLITFVDIFLWNLFLVVPTMIAIFIGESTKNEARKLMNFLGKFSNYCDNAEALQGVRIGLIK